MAHSGTGVMLKIVGFCCLIALLYALILVLRRLYAARHRRRTPGRYLFFEP